MAEHRVKRPVALLAGFLFMLACAGTSTSHTPIGCWQLSFAQWHPPIAAGDHALYYPLPDTVELTTRLGEDGYYEAMRRPNRPPQVVVENDDSLRAFWKPISADSIELWLPVWWSTGIRVRLQQRAARLAGVAEVYVDVVGRPVPQSVVAGQLIACREQFR